MASNKAVQGKRKAAGVTKGQAAAELERQLVAASRAVRTLRNTYDDRGDSDAVDDCVSIEAWLQAAMQESLRGRHPSRQPLPGQLGFRT